MTQQPAASPFPPPEQPPGIPSSGYPQPGSPPPGYPQFGSPPPGYPPLGTPPPPAVPPFPVLPPASGRWEPERIDAVPGTGFGLVHLRVAPLTSGLAIGSLIAGIAAIMVALLVLCFGLVGSSAGWGGWVSGAFALLSVAVGGGAVTLGLVARRQIRRSGQTGQVRFTGGGLAVAGISCGASGAGIALLSLALALLLQLSG